MKTLLVTFLLCLATFATANAGVIEQAQQQQAEQDWSAWGGQIGVRWNRDLLNDYGITVRQPSGQLRSPDARPHQWFEMRQAGGLRFHVANGSMRNFTGGSLQMRGGYVLDLAAGGQIDLRNMTVRVNPDDNMVLDVIGSDGKAWFHVDHLMFELVDDQTRLALKAADLRVSPALAARIGRSEFANYAVADIIIGSEVSVHGSDVVPARVCNPYPWPGVEVPGEDGDVYEADLFMLTVSPQYMRCQGCSSTSNDGLVMFAPSSTLKNNVNDGTPQVTIPGDPLGTSSALYTANVVWNTMFSGDTNPYGNDQHPFLIWNMYRIDPDGLVTQIGRSGVKHAWLTTNGSCLDSCHDGHSLGRGCTDTYGTGNNDANADLGPRSEIIPAKGLWGRCGSIWDPDCNGSGSRYDNSNGSWDNRLTVHESQMGEANHPGSTYLFESWYLAREDINIYNSMSTLDINPRKSGSSWTLSGYSGERLGSAIDRWVDPANPGDNAANTELAVEEGHAKVAVKVTDLGGGNWRYTYAVMNFDFSRAVTEGGGSDPENPDTDHLNVLSNHGFSRFEVPIEAGSTVSSIVFTDGDMDGSNDWNATTTADSITWTAPADNTLDWGSLYSFAVTVNASPVTADATLHVAEAGTPASFGLSTLVPMVESVPADPAAAVNPGNLSIFVAAGKGTTRSFGIQNTGGAGSVLEFTLDVAPTSCDAPGTVAWLDASPASGEVASGATSMATVDVDATELAAGSYSAFVCLHSNDPANPLISVPVNVTVIVNPAEVILIDGFDGTGGIGPGS